MHVKNLFILSLPPGFWKSAVCLSPHTLHPKIARPFIFISHRSGIARHSFYARFTGGTGNCYIMTGANTVATFA